MTSVGFTGTRNGMTLLQWQNMQDKLFSLLEVEGSNQWHDGDCVGADTQAHGSARTLREHADLIVTLHGHPCNLDNQRAHNEYDVTHEVKPPLVRNRDIVDAVDHMIAAPAEFEEKFRGSGTWATIRYARLHKKPLTICWPDGTVSEENTP